MLKTLRSKLVSILLSSSYAEKIKRRMGRDFRPPKKYLCDFDRIQQEVRIADVLLIEGRTMISGTIQQVTRSTWSHSCLYLGKYGDLPQATQALISLHYKFEPQEQLILESLLDKGTVIVPLRKLKHEHIRICRPKYIAYGDAHSVITYAVSHVGVRYDLRHVFDLLRFFMPYSIIPRKWRSSLFGFKAGNDTKAICSTLIADAFKYVDYPILPIVEPLIDGNYKLKHRNTKLCTPSDFDYSPYFDIVKYPFFNLREDYRKYFK